MAMVRNRSHASLLPREEHTLTHNQLQALHKQLFIDTDRDKQPKHTQI